MLSSRMYCGAVTAIEVGSVLCDQTRKERKGNKWWKKTNEKKKMIADCKPPTTTRKSYLSPSLLSLPRRTHSDHNLRYRSHQHPGTITFCFMCRELSRTCMLHPSVDEEVRAQKVLIQSSGKRKKTRHQALFHISTSKLNSSRRKETNFVCSPF